MAERLPVSSRWIYPATTSLNLSSNLTYDTVNSTNVCHILSLKYQGEPSITFFFLSCQTRTYSNASGRPSLWGRFMDNVKQEMAKNKEMKESLKKFREEREKLEQSEALRKAR